jgi:flagellin-like hook-associated protein FlgL
MSDITLSAGVRANLLSLQNTATLMQTTQNRLATGKKVNSALDNPLSYFTSQSLGSRASDLSALLDSMSNGIQTIQAANNGLTSITSTVQSMQSTLNQALQDKSFQTASYSIGTVDTSAVQHLSLSDGAVGSTPVQIDLNTADSTGSTKTSSSAGSAFSTVTSDFAAATGGSQTAASAYAGDEFVGSSGTPASITIDGKTVTFDGTKDGTTAIADTTTNKYTLTEAVSKINHDLAAAGSTVTASQSSGKLVLTNSATGTASNFTIADTTAGGTGGLGSTAITTLSSPGADAGTGASFSLTVGTGSAQSISLNRADVIGAGVDTTTGGGVNSVNLAAAINTKLAAAGITTVQAVKSGTAGTSNNADTISLQATSVGSGTSFTVGSVTGGVVGTTVTAGSGTTGTVKTVDQLVASINGNTSLQGKVTASNDNGKLRLQNISTAALTVTGANSTTADGGTSTTSIAGNDVRKSLVAQFNTLRDQLNKFADDSSYNGVNLLRGDNLKLTLNETGTSALNIQAKDANGNTLTIDSTSLGINAATTTDFNSDSTINDKLSKLTTALSTLRSQASSFGSNLSIVQNRQNFTNSMINTLQTGGDNLVLADTNQEGANLLALQTRQSLSTTALSMAAQSSQAVLQLFG